MAASFAEIAAQVQQLDLDEKEELPLPKAAYAEGTLKSGNLNALMADLNGEDYLLTGKTREGIHHV